MLHLAKSFQGNRGNECRVARTWAWASGQMAFHGLVDCGHIHGQHATTESSQGHRYDIRVHGLNIRWVWRMPSKDQHRVRWGGGGEGC
jgi:hypothetical protein